MARHTFRSALCRSRKSPPKGCWVPETGQHAALQDIKRRRELTDKRKAAFIRAAAMEARRAA